MSIYEMLGIFILFIIVCLGILSYLKLNTDIRSSDYKHFIKKPYLMTIAERKFYDVLIELVGDKYHVIPQVVLSNVVSVDKYEEHKMVYRSKINRNVLDFVLFDKSYFTPYLVIELDDSSHLRSDRKSRDDKVDAILGEVGLRIVHVKTSQEYDCEVIIKTLNV